VARIGLRFDRDAITLDEADANLCGKRLTGEIRLGKDLEGQKKLNGMEDDIRDVSGVFDVKRLTVTPKYFSIGLSFSIESMHGASLQSFAKKTGKLVVKSSRDLPESSAKSDDDGDEDSFDDHPDTGPQPKSGKGQKSEPKNTIFSK